MPWLTNDPTEDEFYAIQILMELIRKFPAGDSSLAQPLANLPWLADGINSEDLWFLIDVRYLSTQYDDLSRLQAALVNTTPGDGGPPPPTRAPRPTLGPPLALSELPWAQDGLTDVEQKALTSLQRIERAHQDTAQVVLSFPWVADSITEDEQLALSYLREIASFVSLFGAGIPDISEIIGETWWLIDGITEKESLFLGQISAIQDPSTMRATFLANSPDDYTPSAPTPTPTPTPAPPSDPSGFPWAQDGLTGIEQEALSYLQSIENKHPAVFETVMGFPWLFDGITSGESLLLCHISATNESGRAYAIALTEQPSDSLPDCPAN